MLNEKSEYVLLLTFVMLAVYILSQDAALIGPF